MSPKRSKIMKRKRIKKNIEFEKNMETENDKEGVKLNNKGKKQKSNEVVSGRMTFPDNPPLYTQPLFFSQRFQKTKLDKQFAKFLNMFKKLEINIPFADAFAQMLNYVKFVKEIMSKKKKLEAYGTVNFSEIAVQLFKGSFPKNSKMRVVSLSLASLGSIHSVRHFVILGRA